VLAIYTTKAINALAVFGPDAEPLKQLAQYIIERKKLMQFWHTVRTLFARDDIEAFAMRWPRNMSKRIDWRSC
jgi:hypothetical protein